MDRQPAPGRMPVVYTCLFACIYKFREKFRKYSRDAEISAWQVWHVN